ncbi:MAG: formylglycine-generating enzyme family protein [Alphaproteobacteria bacterium]|nr:formylglycine-generating enzyme family protein [Alphaproteobacteria bacterium]
MSSFRLLAQLEPQMVHIAPGRFLMGSPESEEGRHDSEGPQHEVVIGYSFEVGRYPVTFREWDLAVRVGGCGGCTPRDEGWGRGWRPVINVSWDDAHKYIEFLKDRTGKSYRLLSEAEWEYCCRAGTTTAYAFGHSLTSPIQRVVFNDGKVVGSSWADRMRPTEPLEGLWANSWGLVSKHGNVWEWCKDFMHASYADAGRPDDGRPWLIESVDDYRIIRGGSCATSPINMRSATRAWTRRTDRSPVIGFRLARTLYH